MDTLVDEMLIFGHIHLK